MGSIGRGLGILVSAAMVVGTVTLAGPAEAAEPTRVHDTSTSVKVVAVDGDRTLEVSVQQSESAGAFAFARLYGGPAGDSLAGGEGFSEWTDTTFRAEVELFDDAGQPVGTVTVGGTHAMTGDGERDLQKFNDGNIHVVMDHTWTPVSGSNVTASFDGAAWQVVEASGWHMTGYLFVSNPATYVGSGEVVAITDWRGDNVTEFYTDEHGTLNETGLYLQYADNPHNASGVIDLSKRTWNGTFGLFDEEGGLLGRMPATATVAAGDPVRFFSRGRGGYERWTFTPYDVELTIDGPLAPAHVTAQLVRIQYAWNTSPLGGPEE
jgi:hypothetical protein